jgi:transcriptional antiterminator RfaH
VLCVRRRARPGKTPFEPMFPRYCFFRPHSAQQSIAPVRNTVGVSHVVRFGSSLATLSDRILEEIRCLEVLQKTPSAENATQFEARQCVTLRQGPLAGIEGVVSEVGARRIVVLLHLLGRETRVSVAAKWVSAA